MRAHAVCPRASASISAVSPNSLTASILEPGRSRHIVASEVPIHDRAHQWRLAALRFVVDIGAGGEEDADDACVSKDGRAAQWRVALVGRIWQSTRSEQPLHERNVALLCRHDERRPTFRRSQIHHGFARRCREERVQQGFDRRVVAGLRCREERVRSWWGGCDGEGREDRAGAHIKNRRRGARSSSAAAIAGRSLLSAIALVVREVE